MAKYKVIFDTDPGIDDMMAIFMMAGHPDIDILAFTTTFGNASVDTTTRNAMYLSALIAPVLGYEVPVYRGVDKPFMFDNAPNFADFVHGTDGLGDAGVPIPAYKTPDTHMGAAEYIVKTVRQHPHEISLVAVGPLGNVALAMLLEPNLPTLCKNICIMGGSFYHKGNITPAAEANTYNSPHESDIVFGGKWGDGSGVAGLDVTYSAPFSQNYLETLATTSDLAQKMWHMGTFYMGFYKNICHDTALHCHDAFAVALITHPELFTTMHGPIRVVPDGISRGQTIIKAATSGDDMGNWNRPSINIAISIDRDGFRTLFADCIKRLS